MLKLTLIMVIISIALYIGLYVCVNIFDSLFESEDTYNKLKLVAGVIGIFIIVTFIMCVICAITMTLKM